MPSDKYSKHQKNIYFKHLEVKEKISQIAKKERRTFSDMMILLCEEAINERSKKATHE